MPQSTWAHPSLWRVVVFALIVGLAVNVLLWPISRDDDWVADAIAVASGITAVALLACWYRFSRWLDDVLIVAFAIWIFNALEFALEDGPRWETQMRQCGLYLTQALLALGAYVAKRTNPVTT